MALDDFKFIYWMEYAHRMWGRGLGLVFALPALGFAARGMVNASLGRRLGLLFAMGATQGFVGWWMVRSGLQVRKVSCHHAAHLLGISLNIVHNSRCMPTGILHAA
jgi:cytochrome c oxidase assembly protein subunit 15